MKNKIQFQEFILFLEAWIFLALSRLLLLLIPFKKLAPLLGKAVFESNTKEASVIQLITLNQISIAIARGCHYSFWRTKCFEQGLSAKMMLRRRGLTGIIYFGVNKNKDTKNMNAHAWVLSNGIIVTGGKNLEQYTVISSFEG